MEKENYLRSVCDKLSDLLDPNTSYNELMLFLNKNSLNANVLIEKFHSLSNWLKIFYAGYNQNKNITIQNSSLDEDTIKLISLLDMVNGLCEILNGLAQIQKACFKTGMLTVENSFVEMRKVNKETDNFFGYSDRDDISYFKQIRAIFGQHPSNLNCVIDGVEKRFFASYTFTSLNKFHVKDEGYDIYCNLYYDVSKDAFGKKFKLSIDELNIFANNVIQNISLHCDVIENEIYSYKNSLAIPIDLWDEALSLEKRIGLLKNTISKRFCESSIEWDYMDELTEIEKLVEIDVPIIYLELYQEYVRVIEKRVDEVHRVITKNIPEDSNYTDLNDFSAIGNHYFISKTHEYFYENGYCDIYMSICEMIYGILDVKEILTPYEFNFYMFVLKQKEIVLIGSE